MDEYSEEKTIFEFEDDSLVHSVWIDGYVDDPDYEEDGLVPDDPRLRRNGLACGRNIKAKDGSGFGCMFCPEIIMTHDVVALRDGVGEFLNGAIDKFGPFPKQNPYGGDCPFFSLELKRNEDGGVAFVAITDVPGSGVHEVSGLMTNDRLKELHEYFTRIVEWFPPRPEEKLTSENDK